MTRITQAANVLFEHPTVLVVIWVVVTLVSSLLMLAPR